MGYHPDLVLIERHVRLVPHELNDRRVQHTELDLRHLHHLAHRHGVTDHPHIDPRHIGLDEVEQHHREPGSVITIDGQELRTRCGHSFVTCHTNRCFRRQHRTARNTLRSLSHAAGQDSDAAKTRGDTEGQFYAAGLRDAYANVARFWAEG